MDMKEALKKLPTWEAALNHNGYIPDEHGEVPEEATQITIREAFSTPDARLLFPRVISRTLREAAEPKYLVTPLLQVVNTDARAVDFPAVNAIRAFEIPEGGEYPEQQLALARQREGKVSKKGVKIAFTEEVIADSQWDIVGLHIRAAGRAMARLKEQIALDRFRNAATTVFDKDDGDATTNTSGVGGDGNDNGSLTWDDILEQAAVLIAENKQPTDFILHPLMWALFLKDPVFHSGGPNQLQGWRTPVGNGNENIVNATAPMGLNTLVSPFVGFTAKDGDTPAKSDVFLIDRNEVGVLLVREGLGTEQFDDPTRDITNLKMRERYDIVALGDGEGITVAKNVSLTRHYDVHLHRQVG